VTLVNIYSTPSPPRVQFGDLLIRHSLLCHVILAGLDLPNTASLISSSVEALLELLTEVAIQTGSMINLLYPLLIAGSLAPAEERDRVESLMAFTKYLTFRLKLITRLSAGTFDVERLDGVSVRNIVTLIRRSSAKHGPNKRPVTRQLR
jgi:hypothetical protein